MPGEARKQLGFSMNDLASSEAYGPRSMYAFEPRNEFDCTLENLNSSFHLRSKTCKTSAYNGHVGSGTVSTSLNSAATARWKSALKLRPVGGIAPKDPALPSVWPSHSPTQIRRFPSNISSASSANM